MDKGRNVGGIVASVVFLAWFLGSLGGLIYFSKANNGVMAVAILGQYFLVFGVIAVISGIKSRTFQPVTLIFPVVGLALIAGAFIYGFGLKVAMAYIERYLPYFILFVFLVVGICVVCHAFLCHRHKKQVCNYSIMATCVDLSQRWHKGRRTYCPVYEIYFRDQTIRLCNHVYSTANNVAVGESKELFINPQNPEEFYEEKQEKIVLSVLYIVGGMFIVVSVLALVVMIFAEREGGMQTNIELGMRELGKLAAFIKG